MRRKALRWAMGILISALSCTSVWAQATAQISGSVRDQTGAVLPGVEITATQTDTGVARNTVTNETGFYVLPNLAIGPYRIEAALPGFRTFVQTGIVLQVNSNPVINPVLEVGQVTEQVEVQANAALVETRASGVGQVIENSSILELPLNGRNVTGLIPLAAAVTIGFQMRGVGIPWNDEGVYSIAGGTSQSTAYFLDGASHNNAGNGLELPMPFPDALQEFKVETGALSAQSGMHASGSISGVTKSGTNQFHGDVFEFVRNYKFNARNFFATRRDTLKRNQFGGTLGGPIIQNRLFFFAGYQGTYLRQDASDTIGFVPTPAMLAGDFTDFASPACNLGRQIALRAPFVNNKINPALFSPAAVKFARQLPATSDLCGRIIYGAPNLNNTHQAIGRIDYQYSAKQSIFGRYVATHRYFPPPYLLSNNFLNAGNSGHNPMTASTGGDSSLAQTFTLGDTYLVSSNTINALRIALNRSATFRLPALYFGPADLGIKMFNYTPGCIQTSVTGGPSASCDHWHGLVNIGTFAANDDVSWLRGNHQIAFGTSASYSQYNFIAYYFAQSRFSFNGQNTGLGMGDFLTGQFSNLTMSPPDLDATSQFYLGLYGQDTWKATPHITLNVGVRWEPFFPAERKDKMTFNFDLDAYRKGIKKTTQFKNSPPGLSYPGDAGFPSNSGMYKRWRNFSPRVGLAWDPSGDGRTSIRASYSLAYDFPSLSYHINTSITSPWIPRVILNGGSYDDPWRDYPGGDPFIVRQYYPQAVTSDAIYPVQNIYAGMQPNTKNLTISQWTLSVQRQIGNDVLVSASYIGTGSRHLWTLKELNPAIYIPGGPCTINGVTYNPCSTTANTEQRRVFNLEDPEKGKYFSSFNFIDDGGTGSYNGLVLSAQRRATRGLTFSGNYTWSHCISDGAKLSTPGGAGGYSDPNNRRSDRGNCNAFASDRRQTLNLTAVAETPQFSNSTLRAVATGWRLSPIVRILSGNVLSVTTSTDIARNGLGGQRVDQILPNVYGTKTISNYLNPNAFALPAVGTRGNMGIASITGPGYWQFDASLSRVFRIGEAQRLEFRAEAFNVTNSLRKGDPVTNFNAANFGQITSASDPRIMQFALKYVF